MGRRDDNRRATFLAVTSAAAVLFASQGYAATSIEQVAAAAGVSPGTVYNYFRTKGMLLLTVVLLRSSQTMDGVTAGVMAGIDDAASDPARAVTSVAMTYVGPLLELERDLIAEVFGAWFRPSRSPLLPEIVAIDEHAIGNVAAILAGLQATGAVRPEVDPGAAATLLFSAVMMALLVYLGDPDMDRAQVEGFIEAQVALAFAGIGPAG